MQPICPIGFPSLERIWRDQSPDLYLPQNHLRPRFRPEWNGVLVKVLLSAFQCCPGMGSEPGNGWQWSKALADAGHEVTVLTHPDFRERIVAEGRDDIDFQFGMPIDEMGEPGHQPVHRQRLWQHQQHALIIRYHP